jgi:elongation factor Ts
MAISAADVKKLRELTDAPMMDCKKALEEADGDFDKAVQILREKGASASAKKAGRATKEGIARIVLSEDRKTGAGIIVECETDFVSRNDDFKAMVNKLVEGMLAAGKAGGDVVVDGQSVSDHITEAVGKIRENIQLRAAEFFTASEGQLAAYNHHDGKWASVVTYTGDNADAAEKVAIQVVAYKPEYLKKEDVPADLIAAELATQTKRALDEGKPEEVAKNIAQGRVNKEFYQATVLLEQLIYTDNKTKVTEFLKQNNGGDVTAYTLLAVGQNAGSEEAEA